MNDTRICMTRDGKIITKGESKLHCQSHITLGKTHNIIINQQFGACPTEMSSQALNSDLASSKQRQAQNICQHGGGGWRTRVNSYLLTNWPAICGMNSMMPRRTLHFGSCVSSTIAGRTLCDNCFAPITCTAQRQHQKSYNTRHKSNNLVTSNNYTAQDHHHHHHHYHVLIY